MNKSIWKYEFNENNSISVPRNSEILDIQLQGDIPVIWFLVDLEEKESEERNFEVFFTGDSIKYYKETTREYLKTLQKGNIAFHIFEKIF